jgi:hypothetical protein
VHLSNEFIRLGNDHRARFQVIGAPYGNRTSVSAVKGRSSGILQSKSEYENPINPTK